METQTWSATDINLAFQRWRKKATFYGDPAAMKDDPERHGYTPEQVRSAMEEARGIIAPSMQLVLAWRALGGDGLGGGLMQRREDYLEEAGVSLRTAIRLEEAGLEELAGAVSMLLDEIRAGDFDRRARGFAQQIRALSHYMKEGQKVDPDLAAHVGEHLYAGEIAALMGLLEMPADAPRPQHGMGPGSKEWEARVGDSDETSPQ
jgi:hypothetical protein